MSEERFNTLLRFFQALGNESRLRIMGILANGERGVGELADLLDLKEPTVSHHLLRLKKLNLVKVRPEGNNRLYSINREALEAMNKEVFSAEKMASLVDNADMEASEGVPKAVEDLKKLIIDADGLLMATPENNNSMPGVFKNAVDWLTRPPEDRSRVFGGLPVGLMGATPGNFGTAFSQYAWLPVLRTLGTQVWSGKLMWVSGARWRSGASVCRARWSGRRLYGTVKRRSRNTTMGNQR